MYVIHLCDDTHRAFEHLYYETKDEAWKSAKEIAMSSAEREFWKTASWDGQESDATILFSRNGLIVQSTNGKTVMELVVEEVVTQDSDEDDRPDVSKEELSKLVESMENLYCYLCDHSDLEPFEILDRYVHLTVEETEELRPYGLYFISTDMKDYVASRSADKVKE